MSEAQYFAEINAESIVIAVHVVTQEFLDDNPDRYPGMYVETFVDVPDKTYAGVGYTYDAKTKNFVPPVYIPQPPYNPVE
jgi:hypothetical protein